MSRVLIGLGGFVVLSLLVVFAIGGTYNRLVTLDQAVQSQWAQVETADQRRADPTYPTAAYYDITSRSNGLYTAAADYDNVIGFGSFESANAYMLKLPIPSGPPNL